MKVASAVLADASVINNGQVVLGSDCGRIPKWGECLPLDQRKRPNFPRLLSHSVGSKHGNLSAHDTKSNGTGSSFRFGKYIHFQQALLDFYLPKVPQESLRSVGSE
jgi:hypothetical protein